MVVIMTRVCHGKLNTREYHRVSAVNFVDELVFFVVVDSRVCYHVDLRRLCPRVAQRAQVSAPNLGHELDYELTRIAAAISRCLTTDTPEKQVKETDFWLSICILITQL